MTKAKPKAVTGKRPVSEGLIVLGMHRSGTSAMSGVLRLLGVDLGARLMPGREGDNERGMFENLDIFEFHERLLTASRRTWHDLTPLSRDWLRQPASSELREELAELLRSLFLDSRLWGVKDPRICGLLLPLWLRVLSDIGADPRFILIHRHPQEIAASLARRNAFSGEKSACLWADHNLRAEHATRGHRRVFVPFEELLTNPLATVKSIGECLDLEWPLSLEEVAKEITAFLSPSMRHHEVRPGRRLADLGRFESIASRLHAALYAQRLTAGEESEERFDSIAELQSTLTGDFDPLLLDHLGDLLRDSQNEREALQLQLDERTEWMRIQSRDLDRMQKTLTAHVEDLQSLKRHMAVLETARNQLETILSSRAWRIYSGLRHRVENRGLKLREILRRRLTRVAPPEAAAGPATKARAAQLLFAQVEDPEVSIVIPAYGHIDFTLQCLESIAAAQTGVEYEVVIVDDTSEDRTFEILSVVPNLRVIRNEENLGFLASCNRGARESRGRYLLLLNNDTEVSDRWLDDLIETFGTFPDAGMVGAKLVFADGTLQEAGGIVWRDGSAWNYGRNQDADTPACNYVREVDFCSGACLLIDRQYYLDLGGFDARYSPGYYEDVDLAFRVRASGKKVYYQPAARIVHHEYVSSGGDLETGFKRFQDINAARFYERWQESLRGHRANGEQPDLEKERGVGLRALVIDHRMLTPDQDAGSVRMFHLIKVLLGEGYKVVFLPENLFAQQPYTRQLQRLGVEVLYHPFVPSLASHLAGAGSLYDLVIVSRAQTARRTIGAVRKHCPQARILFDTVDLHHLREARQAELEDSAELRAQAEITKYMELSVAREADATLVVSGVEKRLLAIEAPEVETHVVSLIHDVNGCDLPFAEREDLLFVGCYEHPPNVDAVHWLVREIMPLVREQLPDVHLYLIGSKPTEDVLELESDQVTITGYVPSVESYFSRCRASLVPIRFGAGVKGKLAHSMSCGLPAVATSLACEGMDLTDGENVRIADGTEAFARSIVELYLDETLWNRLSAGGMEKIEAQFSFSAARQALRSAARPAQPPA
jgi:GT2 family glycosyltransferase